MTYQSDIFSIGNGGNLNRNPFSSSLHHLFDSILAVPKFANTVIQVLQGPWIVMAAWHLSRRRIRVHPPTSPEVAACPCRARLMKSVSKK